MLVGQSSLSLSSLLLIGAVLAQHPLPGQPLGVDRPVMGVLEDADTPFEGMAADLVALEAPEGIPILIEMQSEFAGRCVVGQLASPSEPEEGFMETGVRLGDRRWLWYGSREATVIVFGESPSERGSYTLEATPLGSVHLSEGQPLQGELEDEPLVFTFDVAAARPMVIDVIAGSTSLIHSSEAERGLRALELHTPDGQFFSGLMGGRLNDPQAVFESTVDGVGTGSLRTLRGGSVPHTIWLSPASAEFTLSAPEGSVEFELTAVEGTAVVELVGTPGERTEVSIRCETFEPVLCPMLGAGDPTWQSPPGESPTLSVTLQQTPTRVLVHAPPGQSGTVTLSAKPSAPLRLPDFRLANQNGLDVASSDFDGKPLLVNFWGTWCGPCVAEMPALNAAGQEITARGGGVIGLAVGDTPEAVQTLGESLGITYPLLLDDEEASRAFGALCEEGRIPTYPTTMAFDASGLFLGFVIGRDREAFMAALEPHLGPADAGQ